MTLGSVVAKSAKHLDERLEPNSSPDALKASQLYITTGGSKRRSDEHYMVALQSGVAGGRAGNSSMLARAPGDVSSSSANESVETHLRNYASAGRLEFASTLRHTTTTSSAREGPSTRGRALTAVTTRSRIEASAWALSASSRMRRDSSKLASAAACKCHRAKAQQVADDQSQRRER